MQYPSGSEMGLGRGLAESGTRALLHDYFLYNWREHNGDHKLHGFYHARKAMENAERDFGLNPIEANIIHRHMFPLNPTPPKYRESVVVTCAG